MLAVVAWSTKEGDENSSSVGLMSDNLGYAKSVTGIGDAKVEGFGENAIRSSQCEAIMYLDE